MPVTRPQFMAPTRHNDANFYYLRCYLMWHLRSMGCDDDVYRLSIIDGVLNGNGMPQSLQCKLN